MYAELYTHAVTYMHIVTQDVLLLCAYSPALTGSVLSHRCTDHAKALCQPFEVESFIIKL